MTNLQNNIEIELSEDTDFFNTLEKANLIKEFIENYTPNMTENKIMSLFGEWGSGKSSVLKYIDKQLKKETFLTLYFNSWEYEKDQSLALSLFDALYCEAEKKKVQLLDLRDQAFRVLGAVAKGWTITTKSNYVNEELNSAIITELNLDIELLNSIGDLSKIKEEFLIFINFFIPKLEGDFAFESSSVDSYLNYLNFISNTKGHKFTKFMYSIKDCLRESNGIKIMQLIEVLEKLS